MRIAQVITLFLPEFVGGATLVCARVAHGLRARGHDVAVFCGRPGVEASPSGVHEWEVDGMPVTGVDAASGYVSLDTRAYRHAEITAHFARFLDRRRPDVVHLHSIQALGVTLLDAAAARGIPIVVTAHDWWWQCVRLFLVDPDGFVCAPRVDSARCHCAPGFDLVGRRRELDRALGLAARVLAPSRFLADALIANGVAAERVEVCPNGVELPPARVRRRPGPVRFGYFGGPDNRLKGLPTLRAAVSELDVGGFALQLFGVPPADARVPLALFDRVTCAPAFAPVALGDVLAGLDCLVVPSLMRESYSLVTREALAAGVPVIASDCGGPQEIVRHRVNGLVFATGDAGDLAAQMRRLVLEPLLRLRLAAGAAATPVPTLASQLDQLERVYGEVHRSATDAPAPPIAAGGATASSSTRAAASPLASPATAPASPRASNVAAGTQLRHVLFVTGIDGAPYRYRVGHLREQLRLRGVASDAYYFTDSALPAAVAAADLVVVYRVPMTDWVARWLAAARALRRPLVFSCDDLVFEPAAIPQDALALLPENQRAGWRAYVERYRQTLVACDAFLGTTEALVAAAERAGVPGVVVRNVLGAAELTTAESARHAAACRARNDEVVRLAYLSGTIMHDLDFALAEPALAAVLRDHSRARLLLVGYVRTGAELAALGDRVDRLPFVAWPRLFATLAEIDVNLAPLRGDAFSDAKSEVKYLEAAAVAVPTVASPTAAFRRAIRDGVNGVLAATRDDWYRALATLVADGAFRRRLGNAAHTDVCLHAAPAAHADALVAALRNLRDAAAVSRAAPTMGPSMAAAPPASTCAGARPSTPATAAPPTAAAPAAPAVAGAKPLASEAPSTPCAGAHDGGARYDLEPDDAMPGTAQPARDGSSPPLAAGRAVGQRFRAAADDLYRIDVCVAGGAAIPVLVVRVATIGPEDDETTPSRRAVREARIAAGPVAEDAWLAAEFTPIGAGAGRELYCWVETAEPGTAAAEPATTVEAVVLRTYACGWGETPPAGLYVDHRPVAGSLAFRTFHRPARGGT